MFNPPAKAARTERHTVSTTTVTATTTTTTNTTTTFSAQHRAKTQQQQPSQFMARRTGASTRSFTTGVNGNSAHHHLINGIGKQLAWTYSSGSKHIAVWNVANAQKLTTADIGGPAPVFKTSQQQGEVAFIAECEGKKSNNGSNNNKALAFCTSLGAVRSTDGGINFNYEYESTTGGSRPFDVRSFAVIPAEQSIAAPMFHNELPPAEHLVAGTEDGYLLCAFNKKNNTDGNDSSTAADAHYNVLYCNVAVADAECAPAIAADFDLSGGGDYLMKRHSARVPTNKNKAIHNPLETASNATSRASQSSWWKSWIPGALRNNANADANDDSVNYNDETKAGVSADGLNDDRPSYRDASSFDAASLNATGSSKALAKLPNRRIDHVQGARNGICFSVGGEAVALATKVSGAPILAESQTDDTDGDLPQNGLKLVWSCPVVAIASPHRAATIVAVTAVDSTVYALVLHDDDPSSGTLVALNAYNGSITTSRQVQLPAEVVFAAADGTDGSAPHTRIELLIPAGNGNSVDSSSSASSNNGGNGAMTASSVSVVINNSITHMSLHATVRNPCLSTDVESLNENVLASGVVNGQLYVLTNDGPFPSDEACELDAARARQQLSRLLDTIRADANGRGCSADEAVLAASDEVLYSAESHADNWARVYDSSSAKEDLNVLTFVTAQLHQRQLKHRTLIATILGNKELVGKLSPATIARLISDQEQLLALRYLRDLQNASPTDGLHEMIQEYLRRGLVAVAQKNRATSRLNGGGNAVNRASNAEVFYADHGSVIDLMSWSVTELSIIVQSSMNASAKMEAAMAVGNIIPRVLEAVYESRVTIAVPSALAGKMWTAATEHTATKVGAGAAAADVTATATIITSHKLVKQLAEGLAFALEGSVRHNSSLAVTHNAAALLLTAGGATTDTLVDVPAVTPVSADAQQAVLGLIDSLLSDAVGLEVTAAAAANPIIAAAKTASSVTTFGTTDFAAAVAADAAAERLITRTLLRQPFLVPAHVSPSTGEIHMYGYPYGSPKPNPAAGPIGTAIIRLVEQYALKYQLYNLLYVFALSDPNSIDAFLDETEEIRLSCTASGHTDAVNRMIADAAARNYGLYQQYCAAVPTFFPASLHLFLSNERFQREHEVCHSAKMCGLDGKTFHPSAVRNLFLKTYAPQLLWAAVPEYVDTVTTGESTATSALPVGGEAAFALLREGLTDINALNIPAGVTSLNHRGSCAALANLCWQSYNTEAMLDATVAGSNNDDEDTTTESSTAVSSTAATSVAKAVTSRINLDLAVVGYQAQFLANSRHATSILAAPELVDLLLALPDNVDAWCAAAAVCDCIGSVYGRFMPTTTGVVGSSSASASSAAKATTSAAELLQKIYATAMKHDGGAEKLLAIQQEATSEGELSRKLAATAQGRVILASHALSGLKIVSEVGAISSSTAVVTTTSAGGRTALHVTSPSGWSLSTLSPNSGMIPSATGSPYVPHRSSAARTIVTTAAARNTIGLVLGNVLAAGASSAEASERVVKLLVDWVAVYSSNGGVVVAPSPAIKFDGAALVAGDLLMPQTHGFEEL